MVKKIEKNPLIKTSNKSWTVIITCDEDGTTNFIYDENVDRYKLVGLLEVEIDMIKKELLSNIKGG